MVGVKRGKLWVVTGGVALTMVLAMGVRVVAEDAKGQQKAAQKRIGQATLSLDPVVVEDGVDGTSTDGALAPVVEDGATGMKGQQKAAQKRKGHATLSSDPVIVEDGVVAAPTDAAGATVVEDGAAGK